MVTTIFLNWLLNLLLLHFLLVIINVILDLCCLRSFYYMYKQCCHKFRALNRGRMKENTRGDALKVAQFFVRPKCTQFPHFGRIEGEKWQKSPNWAGNT